MGWNLRYNGRYLYGPTISNTLEIPSAHENDRCSDVHAQALELSHVRERVSPGPVLFNYSWVDVSHDWPGSDTI